MQQVRTEAAITCLGRVSGKLNGCVAGRKGWRELIEKMGALHKLEEMWFELGLKTISAQEAAVDTAAFLVAQAI